MSSYLHSTELVLAFGLSISNFNSFIFLVYLLPPYPNVKVDRVSKNLGIHLLSIEKIFYTLLVLLLAGDMFSLWSSGLPQTRGNSPASRSWVLGWQMWASTSIRVLTFWLWKGFPPSSFLPSLSVCLPLYFSKIIYHSLAQAGPECPNLLSQFYVYRHVTWYLTENISFRMTFILSKTKGHLKNLFIMKL